MREGQYISCRRKISPQGHRSAITQMSDRAPEPDSNGSWRSVHSCPRCGHIVDLAEIDLRAVATGIIRCPNCDYSGPVTIEIVVDSDPQNE